MFTAITITKIVIVFVYRWLGVNALSFGLKGDTK